MFKTIFTPFFSFLFLVLLAACEKSGSDHKTLVIGTSVDNPPFEFYHEGKMTGFDIELGTLIAKKMNRDVKFVDMSFDTIIAALQSKKVDIGMAAISPTEERTKAVDFTTSYHTSFSALVTPGLTDITDISKLKGQVVGAQLGTHHEAYGKTVLTKKVNVEIRSLGKVTDLIQELRNQRIAGLITGVGEADKIIEMNSTFKAMALPDNVDNKAIALPKGSELTKAINDILAALEADGTLAELRKKWKLD